MCKASVESGRSASRVQQVHVVEQGNINQPVSPSDQSDAPGGMPEKKISR
jgi:hypothetical protein